MGADVVVGTTQRFGVPLGYGGPHAAYFATREAHKRLLPGRLVGISQDAQGRPALRLALQTREQHIRRDKATSNICTAQVLLAVVASMYAVYHGPRGLRQIAERIHRQAHQLAAAIRQLGYKVGPEYFFDTFWVRAASPEQVQQLQERAAQKRINLRRINDVTLGISLDEATTDQDLRDLWQIFAGSEEPGWDPEGLGLDPNQSLPPQLLRSTPYLTHPVFNRYHSETELQRYIHRLQSRDLSLVHAMIPLGSCTMKLNAAAEMLPITWPEFAQLHPFVPLEQARGYQTLFAQLERMLAEITGFAGVSLQPNAGSQGEYAGLLAIRRYHQARGESQRQVCLIPTSAHGTNPASAVMAGMQVVSVACDRAGNIDLEDLRAKVEQHRERLAALMITYPSTHGVFEEGIREICQMIHEAGVRCTWMGPTSMPRWASAVLRSWEPMSATLTCTRPSASPTAGAGQGGAHCGCPSSTALFAWPSLFARLQRPGQRRPLGQCQHPAHCLGLHPPHGIRWPHPGHPGGHPQRQLHCQAAGSLLPSALQRAGGVGGPRVHLGLAPPQEKRRH